MLVLSVINAAVLTPLLVLINLPCAMVRLLAVRGSRQRFAALTLDRAFGWNWIVANACSVVYNSAQKNYALLSISIIGLVCGLSMAWRIYTSDDDDWFTGRGRRIKKWAAKKTASAKAALSPGTGGLAPSPA